MLNIAARLAKGSLKAVPGVTACKTIAFKTATKAADFKPNKKKAATTPLFPKFGTIKSAQKTE